MNEQKVDKLMEGPEPSVKDATIRSRQQDIARQERGMNLLDRDKAMRESINRKDLQKLSLRIRRIRKRGGSDDAIVALFYYILTSTGRKSVYAQFEDAVSYCQGNAGYYEAVQDLLRRAKKEEIDSDDDKAKTKKSSKEDSDTSDSDSDSDSDSETDTSSLDVYSLLSGRSGASSASKASSASSVSGMWPYGYGNSLQLMNLASSFLNR